LPIDRCKGSAEIFPGARFYLHEDQRVVVATNDVDLAAAAPLEIAVKNLVTLTPQEPAGQLLAVSAAPKMVRSG